MKRKRIKIVDNDKKVVIRTIKTIVVNDLFAVHGTINSGPGPCYDEKSDTSINRKKWTLTHIPTGAAVTKMGHDKNVLIRAVDVLMEMGDWNFTDPEEALKRFDGKQVMAAVRWS